MATEATETKTYTVPMPGGLLKALSACGGGRERLALDCLHINGPQIEAADGTVLARLILPEGQTLGPEALYKIDRQKPYKRDGELTRSNGRLVLAQEGRESLYKGADPAISFPDTDKVLAGHDPLASVEMGVAPLHQLLHVAEETGNPYVEISLAGKRKPVRIATVNTAAHYGEQPPRLEALIAPVVTRNSESRIGCHHAEHVDRLCQAILYSAVQGQPVATLLRDLLAISGGLAEDVEPVVEALLEILAKRSVCIGDFVTGDPRVWVVRWGERKDEYKGPYRKGEELCGDYLPAKPDTGCSVYGDEAAAQEAIERGTHCGCYLSPHYSGAPDPEKKRKGSKYVPSWSLPALAVRKLHQMWFVVAERLRPWSVA